jgi:hypothetical protein
LTRTSASQAGTRRAAPTPPLSQTGTKSRDNAEIYRAAYGEAEAVAELIPFMLEAFLESDRAFAKALKDGVLNIGTPSPDRSSRPQRRDPAPSSSIVSAGS